MRLSIPYAYLKALLAIMAISLALPSFAADKDGFGINVFEKKKKAPWSVKLGGAPHKSEVTLQADQVLTRSGDTLTSAGQQQVERLAGAILVGRKVQKVRVTGFTDSVGSNADNDARGARYAQTVRDALNARGVSDILLETVSMGETAPVASNVNANGRAANRRVLVEVVGLRADLVAVVAGEEVAKPEYGSYKIDSDVKRTTLEARSIFHPNSNRFTGAGEFALEQVANQIRSVGAYREVIVLGHSTAGNSNPQSYSQQIADRVLRFLVDHGVDSRTATSLGLGSTLPNVSNPRDPRNARVVIEIHPN